MRDRLALGSFELSFFNLNQETQMDVQKYLPALIGVGLCVAIAKYAPNAMVKAAALGAAGVIVGKQLPYIGAALA